MKNINLKNIVILNDYDNIEEFNLLDESNIYLLKEEGLIIYNGVTYGAGFNDIYSVKANISEIKYDLENFEEGVFGEITSLEERIKALEDAAELKEE